MIGKLEGAWRGARPEDPERQAPHRAGDTAAVADELVHRLVGRASHVLLAAVDDLAEAAQVDGVVRGDVGHGHEHRVRRRRVDGEQLLADASEVRTFARGLLPEPMVPAVFVAVATGVMVPDPPLATYSVLPSAETVKRVTLTTFPARLSVSSIVSSATCFTDTMVLLASPCNGTSVPSNFAV